MEIVRKAFNWTASAIGAACVGRMRAAFDHAYEFARTDKRSGPVPVINYQNVGYMLVDIKTCFPVYDGGNLGVRRRQLHALLSRPDDDPVASAQGRLSTAHPPR